MGYTNEQMREVKRKLRGKLDEAVRHIKALMDEGCSFIDRCKPGETCREAQTRIQGVPCSGCANCEAREFLKRLEGG